MQCNAKMGGEGKREREKKKESGMRIVLDEMGKFQFQPIHISTPLRMNISCFFKDAGEIKNTAWKEARLMRSHYNDVYALRQKAKVIIS